MSGKSHPLPTQDWLYIAGLVTEGGIPKKSDIAGALRSATPKIDDLIRLMLMPEVYTFLQGKELAAEMLDDPVVEQFLGALKALLYSPLQIIPAEVQHCIADLLTQKRKGRPKQTPTQLELAQWRKAEDLTKAIRIIRRKNDMCSLAQACSIYGKEQRAGGKMVETESVKREYRKALEITKRRRAEYAAIFKRSAQLLGESPRQMIRRNLKAIANRKAGLG
jgi:hypothetical protein